MTPIIDSIVSTNGFETGFIKISGSGFKSKNTLLLINGIPANIESISDTFISATIPVLGESGVFSVIAAVSTGRDDVLVEYSNAVFVEIQKLSQAQIDARTPPVIIPDESKLQPLPDDYSTSSSSESDSTISSSISSISSLTSSTSESSDISSGSSDTTSSSSDTSITSGSSSTSSDFSDSTLSSDSTGSSLTSISSVSTQSSVSISSVSTNSSDTSVSTQSSSTSSSDTSVSTQSSSTSSSDTSNSSQSTLSSDSTSSDSSVSDDPLSSSSLCSLGSLEHVQTFSPSGLSDGDSFGSQVVMSKDGSTAVMGYGASTAQQMEIYKRNSLDDQWGHIQTISTGGSGNFGQILAISGDGQRFATNEYGIGGSGAEGSVYIYSFDGDEYTLEETVQADDGGLGNQFGSGIAIDFDGNTLAVGATGDDSNTGAIYVFKRDGNDWSQQQKIIGSNAVSQRGLGGLINSAGHCVVSISSDGKTILSGSSGSITPSNGGVWIFVDQDGSWVEDQRITAYTASDANGKYTSISSDGNRIAFNGGATVYYFIRVEDTWTEQDSTSVLTSSTQAWIEFSGSGDRLFVGDGLNDDDASNAGRAYFYDIIDNSLSLNETISSPNIEAQARFGGSMAVNETGEMVLIGAQDEDNGGSERGNMYYYSCEGIEESVSSSSESGSESTSSNTLSSTSNSQPSSSSSSMSSSSNSNSSSTS